MGSILPPVTWAYSSKDEDAKPPILELTLCGTLRTAGLPDQINQPPRPLGASSAMRSERMSRAFLKSYEIVVGLTLPTWVAQAAIAVSSFTFHLTVSC